MLALLFFLVCAVIGSVVLAAGSAAAGRISQLARSDRRYYAVTSAAELLAQKLDGQTVTVTRTSAAYPVVTTVTAGDSGNTTTVTTGEPGSWSKETTGTGLLKSVVDTVTGDPIPMTDTTVSYTMTASRDSGSVPPDVDVTAVISKDGALALTVSNDRYSLKLIFSVKTESETASEKSGQPTATNDRDNNTVTETQLWIDKETTVYTWTLTDIEKVVAA